MEILESIPRDQMPAAMRDTAWSELAEQMIRTREAEQVTVIKVKDHKELEKLRGGIAHRLTQKGWKARTVPVPEEGGIRVFIDLVQREEKPAPTVVTQPIKRIRIPSLHKQQEA